MKKKLLSVTLACLCCMSVQAETRSIESSQEEKQPTELIKNYSFEDEAHPIRNRRFGPNGEGELFGGRLPEGTIPGWITANSDEAASKMEITTENLISTTEKKALRWSITEATATAPAAIANVGFHGIKAVKGNTYTLSFWARADKRYKGTIRIGLQSKSDDSIWYAQTTVKGKLKKRWKRYSFTFTPEKDAQNTRFIVTASKPGTLYFDCISLHSPSIKR